MQNSANRSQWSLLNMAEVLPILCKNSANNRERQESATLQCATSRKKDGKPICLPDLTNKPTPTE